MMRLRLHMALAVALMATACSSPDDPSGDLQLVVVQAPTTTTPGGTVSQSVIVKVVNGDGTPVPGVPVQWSIRTGGGSVTPVADSSGVGGLAVAEWIPGLATGPQQIGVTIYDQPAVVITVEASALHVDKIAVSYRDGCGLAGTAVWCWEHTSFYGPTATTRRVLPQLQLTDLAVTSGYVCALDASGTTYCHGTSGPAPPESYVTPSGLPPIRAISGQGANFCGIALADGTPWCWSQGTRTPVQISATLQLASISAGGLRSCGLTSSGSAWCWDGVSGTPVAVPGGHSFRSISAGQFSICAIQAPTSLYCWDPDETPVAIPGVAPTEVAMGTFNENLVIASANATMFYLADYYPSGFYLETASALPLPSRQVADHCALAFDGTVYCTSAYIHTEEPHFIWAAIPGPVP